MALFEVTYAWKDSVDVVETSHVIVGAYPDHVNDEDIFYTFRDADDLSDASDADNPDFRFTILSATLEA